MRPKSYAVQDGCHNCKRVFVRQEYEECDILHCTLKAGPRPPCGSVLMGENFIEHLKRQGVQNGFLQKSKKLIDAWDKWSKENMVADSGKCDNWERR